MPIHILNKNAYEPAAHALKKEQGLKGEYVEPHRIFYVGRPSVLGNPYYHERAMSSWSVNGYLVVTTRVVTREDAVQRYRNWLYMHLEAWRTAPNAPTGQVWKEVLRITDLIKKEPDEDWGLMCWCSPQACHAGVIKSAIEWVLKTKEV